MSAPGKKAVTMSMKEPASPVSPASTVAAATREYGGKAQLGNMSIQAQLEMNDVPEFANEPGPGHYFGPGNNGFSSFGVQKFSNAASAPSFKFKGMTGWDDWKGVLISKGHNKAVIGRESPGAKYALKENELSEKYTKFGTSLRPDLSASLGVDKNGSPGPKYNVRETQDMRFDLDVKRMADLKKGFGKEERFNVKSNAVVGPGHYPRTDSALNLENGKSFGCQRSAYEKVIRPGWEKDGQCKVSDGVGCPLWTDPSKEASRYAGNSIGRARRFTKDEKSKEPGPGQYPREERSIGNLHSFCTDTRTPSSVKFGKVPRKPRFRQQLAMNTAKHGAWGYF